MKKSNTNRRVSRRTFLKRIGSSGIAATAPLILPASVFGKTSPSNRLAIGCIGTGGMGMNHVRTFSRRPDCQLVAVCDVDSRHLARALKESKLPPNAGYKDYQELLARDDLDAVVIATPDHWHVPIALDAVGAGKDVYCEKPLSHSILEGRELVAAVRHYNAVFQTGSQQRSSWRFRFACELVRNRKIGEVRQIWVWIPPNSRPNPLHWQPQTPPPELDYERWLGPAPTEPYTEKRCHYSFRFIRDYSGGQLTNWGAHHLDIAQWALGSDYSGPVKIQGRGEFPITGLFNTATHVDLTYEYSDGLRLFCRTGGSGILIVGSEGTIYVDRKTLKTEPPSLAKVKIGGNEIRLPRSKSHIDDFLEAVRWRRRPIADVEIGHRSATVCHLGNIAMLTGMPIEWDPVGERITNYPTLNRWLLPERCRDFL